MMTHKNKLQYFVNTNTIKSMKIQMLWRAK